MVNVPSISSQSNADEDGSNSVESPADNKLPENSKANLDVRLDHAIEETFPTSDPVSVTITKGPKPDGINQGVSSSSADDQQVQSEQNSTGHILDQVREALHDVADQASGVAREMYNRGEHYAQQAREQYPQAERHIRDGQRAMTQKVTDNPLLALFMAGIAGYVLAWLIHGERRTREHRVPDYGRTVRGYAPYRDE